MRCTQCSTLNPAAARFCFSCGKLLEQPTPVQTGPVVNPATPTAWPDYPPPTIWSGYAPPAPLLPSNNPVYPYGPPTTPSPYNNNYPLANGAAPGSQYAPFTSQVYNAKLGYYHPLLQGAVGLPFDIYQNPKDYYSYVTAQNRVVVCKRAGFWQRVGATAVDAIVLFIPNLILFVLVYSTTPNLHTSSLTTANRVSAPAWFYVGLCLLNFGYLIWGGQRGQTLGKKATRLRIIRLDGRYPGWFLAFLRQFCGYLLSCSAVLPLLFVASLLTVVSRLSSAANTAEIDQWLILVGATLGFLWVLWDPQKQAWHDKLARTLVVEDVAWVEGQSFMLPPRSPVG